MLRNLEPIGSPRSIESDVPAWLYLANLCVFYSLYQIFQEMGLRIIGSFIAQANFVFLFIIFEHLTR